MTPTRIADVLAGFSILDPQGRPSGALRLAHDHLVPPDNADDDLLAFVAELNARKHGLLWAGETWRDFLATWAAGGGLHDAYTVSSPAGEGETAVRPRVAEFPRRLALIERLLAGEQRREDVLASLVAEAMLQPLEEVTASLEDPDEAPRVAGLSAPSLSTDVQALRRMGFGFDPHPAHVSRQAYRLETRRLPLWVDPREATVLRNARAIFAELGLPEAETLAALLERVSPAVRERIGPPDLDRALAGAGDDVDPVTLALLREALLRKSKALRIRYQSALAKEPRVYLLEHPRLVWLEGHLYVLAHCPRAEGETRYDCNREFRMDRFAPAPGMPAVQVVDTVLTTAKLPTFWLTFRAKPDFAPRFGEGQGRVKVGPREADGSRVVRIDEAVPLRAIRRLLSYGDRVTPLGPEFVVARYRETLAAMAAALEPPP